jgi:hypothetical protein
MAENRDERIRQRAYEIWEREGRPEGRHDEHWRRAAEEELAREGAGTPAGAGEEPKASSGRTAGKATRQNGPETAPADKRTASKATRAPGEGAPRAKSRKADTAGKNANERTTPTPRTR